MRTTLDIDNEVLDAARELARRQHQAIGKVISDLARKALRGDIAAAGSLLEPFERGVAVFGAAVAVGMEQREDDGGPAVARFGLGQQFVVRHTVLFDAERLEADHVIGTCRATPQEGGKEQGGERAHDRERSSGGPRVKSRC